MDYSLNISLDQSILTDVYCVNSTRGVFMKMKWTRIMKGDAVRRLWSGSRTIDVESCLSVLEENAAKLREGNVKT